MRQQPILLTPEDVSILLKCPLHYHFSQQPAALPAAFNTRAELRALVQDTIQYLHAGGGPARVSLDACLERIGDYAPAQQMLTTYYQRLVPEWRMIMAGNETMSLNISIGRVGLTLQGTIDRLDQTRDGGILAILFGTDNTPPPTVNELRQSPAMTIYHALVATTYPLKRPVRLQEMWLYHNQAITVELSEDEYRQNLALLRQPVQALARGEVMARPGLHCDTCPFKHHGCPVYAHEADKESSSDDFAPAATDGKISPRNWVFKI